MSQSAVLPGGSREVFLDTAEQLIARVGYERASISMICRQAGLPSGSLYHHFGNKAGLLAAVIERGTQRFFLAMPRPSETAGTPDERVRAYWDASADAIIANLNYFQVESDVLRHGRSDPRVVKAMTKVRELAEEHLAAVLTPYAHDLGIKDPEPLVRRLVTVSLTYARGAALEAGTDVDHLRMLMSELYYVVRASLVAASRTPLLPHL